MLNFVEVSTNRTANARRDRLPLLVQAEFEGTHPCSGRGTGLGIAFVVDLCYTYAEIQWEWRKGIENEIRVSLEKFSPEPRGDRHPCRAAKPFDNDRQHGRHHDDCTTG